MQKYHRLLIFAGWGVIAGIWILSLLPLNSAPPVPGGDKVHHFIAYGTLMFVWMLALPKLRWHWQIALAIAFAIMGLVVEYAQGLTTFRYFDLYDALANALGVACGWIMATIARFWLLRPAKSIT